MHTWAGWAGSLRGGADREEAPHGLILGLRGPVVVPMNHLRRDAELDDSAVPFERASVELELYVFGIGQRPIKHEHADDVLSGPDPLARELTNKLVVVSPKVLTVNVAEG